VPKNYSGPRLFTFYFYVYFRAAIVIIDGEVFLGFGGWVRRFGCPKIIQDLEFLLLTFTFVSAQQLSSSIGRYFWDLEGG
jgi:hypothetical protein